MYVIRECLVPFPYIWVSIIKLQVMVDADHASWPLASECLRTHSQSSRSTDLALLALLCSW